jgi:hypothetical protein
MTRTIVGLRFWVYGCRGCSDELVRNEAWFERCSVVSKSINGISQGEGKEEPYLLIVRLQTLTSFRALTYLSSLASIKRKKGKKAYVNTDIIPRRHIMSLSHHSSSASWTKLHLLVKLTDTLFVFLFSIPNPE